MVILGAAGLPISFLAIVAVGFSGFALYRQFRADLRQKRVLRSFINVAESIESRVSDRGVGLNTAGYGHHSPTKAIEFLGSVEELLVGHLEQARAGSDLVFAQKEMIHFAARCELISPLGAHWHDRLMTLALGWLGIYENGLSRGEASQQAAEKIEQLLTDVARQSAELEKEIRRKNGGTSVTGLIPEKAKANQLKLTHTAPRSHFRHVYRKEGNAQKGNLLART